MLLSLASLLALSALSLAAPPAQSTFNLASSHAASSTAPVSLASIGEDAHSHFSHAAFPGYGMRIKQTSGGWCDPTVRSFTGYIDVTGYGQSLFFYFFESRSKPAEDDVIFWINGGPGASSAFGLFMELGPCRISPETDDLVFNPHSWNSNANIFFLDQPAGVGFSFSQAGQPTHRTTEDAAVDVQAFISLWFETFKEFEGRKFHMSGESYGGRYLPVFASAVVDGNRLAASQNRTKINLQSVLIGNGWTDSLTMYEGYVKQQCTSYSGQPPIQTIATCVKLNEALPLCQKMVQAECRDRFDLIACGNAVDFCTSITITPFRTTGYNWYDITDDCQPECLADPLERALFKYMNRPSTYATLGIDPSFPNSSWTLSSEAVSLAFGGIGSGAQLDVHRKTYLYVAGLLENGIRVLIYAGKTDFACNALGISGWLKMLPWTGLASYLAAPVRNWFVPGPSNATVAGQVRRAGLLTFVEVEGAGHLVPLHKPVESLWMLTRWLAGKDL